MRNTTIALIEFHWLPPTPPRVRKPTPTPRPARPAPTTGGYQFPGGGWRAFLGSDIYGGGSPIVFLHVVPDEDESPAPPAVWHRIH